MPATRQPAFRGVIPDEVVADGALLSGADGVVPGLGNVDPAGYVRLYDTARRGDWATAKAEQDRLALLLRIVDAADPSRSRGSTSGVGAFKTALVELGVIGRNAVSAPHGELDAGEADAMQEAGLL